MALWNFGTISPDKFASEHVSRETANGISHIGWILDSHLGNGHSAVRGDLGNNVASSISSNIRASTHMLEWKVGGVMWILEQNDPFMSILSGHIG